MTGFACIIVATVAMEAKSFGAYFVEVTHQNEIFAANDHSFNKYFHRCSIKNTCNYI